MSTERQQTPSQQTPSEQTPSERAQSGPTPPATGPGPAAFALRGFAPGWGAAVMGTSALSVALLVLGEGSSVDSALTALARVILVVAVALGVVVLSLTAARWIKYSAEARADLRHPVKGGMTATAAGALLTLAVAIGRVGPGLLPSSVIEPTIVVLVALGTVLALIIGWEFLGEMFTSKDVALVQVSGAWFVPPVVTIIVPLALLPIAVAHPDLGPDLLALGWAFLGMGAVLYLVVTATLFVRSVSHPLPPAVLAPTLFIGMGPAGLLGLDIARMGQVSVQLGLAQPAVLTTLLPAATALWGFGLWWMVAATVVLRRGYARVPFALSWWGFTFPLAAWTIATIVLGRAWESGLLTSVGWIAAAVLTVLWGYVVGRTLAGIRSGSIWAG